MNSVAPLAGDPLTPEAPAAAEPSFIAKYAPAVISSLAALLLSALGNI